MNKFRNIIADYDYYLLFTYVLLVVFGLIMQLNISSVRTEMTFFYRQLLWFILSIGAVWIGFKKIDLDKIRKYIFPLVLFTLILLILVLFLGESVKGSIRSFRIWKINIQPSIIARIVLIFYVAHILDKKEDQIKDSRPLGFLRNFSALVIIPLAFFSLILIEKHFTPLIISSLTLISLLFLAKIRISTIALILMISLLAGFIVLQFGPDYRSRRFESYRHYSLFFKDNNKEIDGKSDDYQVKQSLISLASGRIFGTSPRKGTGKHYFLPEAKTDYIFAIIGEEFGFLGALTVLILYIFFFFRTIMNADRYDDLYIRLLGWGLGMNIFYNAMVNIGVAISALPSTGVTLPFISYGGTSLLLHSFSVGLLLNISAERRSL